MARVLAEGTGAEWSQVWLVVGDRPTLAATWPPEATRERAAETRTPRSTDEVARAGGPCAVRHGGELLGVLVVQEREQRPLTLGRGAALRRAGRPGRAWSCAARGCAPSSSQRLAELSARADELRGSRERLVDVQDDERRLPRARHPRRRPAAPGRAGGEPAPRPDAGRAARRTARTASSRDQEQAAAEAIDTLVQLSRGIYPPLLAERRLVAALRAGGRHQPGPGRGHRRTASAATPRTSRRRRTSAAWRPSRTPPSTPGASRDPASTSRDEAGHPDGASSRTTAPGFDPATATAGTGLTNMRDRIESRRTARCARVAPPAGTRIEVRLPRRGPREPTAGD